MQPRRSFRRLHRCQTSRQQTCDEPCQHIARPGRRQPRGRSFVYGQVDHAPSIRRSDHRVRALEQNHAPSPLCGSTRRIHLENAGPLAGCTFICAAMSGNNLANSPPCGVSTHLSCNRAIRAPGSSAKADKASASNTVARRAARTIGTSARARSNSSAGPRQSAFRRVSSRISGNPLAPSTRCNMRAVIWLATSICADGGTPSVTSPAPTRKAPRAAKRAAPVLPAPRQDQSMTM